MAELRGADIVCVGSALWASPAPLNVHHVMRRLASRNRVLYVESPGLRPPAARSGGDWRKVGWRLRGWLRGLSASPEGVWLLSPPLLPWHGQAWARALNRRLLVGAVRRAMRRLDLREPLLWVFLPTGEVLAGALAERLLVYHCVDAYAENPGVDREAILALEARLLARCDLVFTTSPALHAEKRPVRGRAHFVPNVADAEHFAAGGPEPPALAAIGRPRLGYVGNLAGYKLDIPLLAAVAAARPDWQFCLVGPRGAGDPGSDLSALEGLANLHWLGLQPYAALPAFVGACDVCLIPFRLSASTRASFPLKFYEYMAAGKAIVATPLPALADYAERPALCRFAAEPAAFVAAVEAALAEGAAPALIAARRAEAAAHSWPVRLAEIESAVLDALAAKAAGHAGAAR